MILTFYIFLKAEGCYFSIQWQYNEKRPRNVVLCDSGVRLTYGLIKGA